ncbi:MAG: serine/threonine-protein kinase [Acidobacteria bacterium]|jgi:serine/threonine-protein kinase|nr:serine/threonine-protein kinase [Acidobacteriota bacterium]
MDGTRWERLQALFHGAVDLPPDARDAYLLAEGGDDPDLVAEVAALLNEDGRGGSVLDHGVAPVAEAVLGDADPDLLPRQRFGPYAITGILGEGGMGIVYRAERDDLGSQVAIKVLRDAWLSRTRRERFAAEQRTLAQLSHPSIARLYDADALPDGTPWFVMEYVEGVPLTAYCRAHATSIEGRLELVRAVGEAVQYAHAQAVIHRDLKPSNILVTPDGTVKLLDFGIAKHLESLDAPADQTRTGLRQLTPAYAAPEQVRGDPVGIRTDVYALGVILYELLTGQLPFDVSNRAPAEAVSIVTEREPERPSAVARRTQAALDHRSPAGLPLGPWPRLAGRISWPDLDVLCLTAMHRDPQRRYPTVEALIRDLDRYLAGEPLQARPDTVGYRLGKFVQRNRAAVAAAALALATVVALVAFYTVRLARARNAAVAEAARTERIQRFMLRLFEGDDGAVGPADDLRVVTLVERGVQEARSLSAEPAVQAEFLGTLGGIYQKLGRLEQADELLRSALDQRRTLLGPESPDVAASTVALGLLRSDQAQFEEGERLVREGLAASRRALPADHPAVAAATAALGHVLVEKGSYVEATQVLEEAVRLQELHGATTPETAAALHELSSAHFYQGHWPIAESLTHRVLELDRALYGAHHPHVADDLVDLGAIQHEQGRYADAERYYREALEITRSWFGTDHYKTASNLTMLGRSLVFQKRFEEAETLLREALAIQERVFGPDHPRVASAVNELGNVALQRDQLDDAEAAYRRMVEIYRKAYPKGHYLVGIALSNLASVQMARGENARAEQLFREALAVYGATLGPDHTNTAIARIKLGRSLLRQQRYAEAERETSGGYAIMVRQADPAVSFLTAARSDLAAIYDALGRPERAAEFRVEPGGTGGTVAGGAASK